VAARDDDLEEALSSSGPVSPATAFDVEPVPEPKPGLKQRVPLTRLQAKLNAKRGRSMLSAKIAAGVAAVLILAIGFYGWKSIGHGSDPTDGGIQVAALDENRRPSWRARSSTATRTSCSSARTSRPGSAVSGTQSTDTMMVVHIPVDGSRVEVVSFPRTCGEPAGVPAVGQPDQPGQRQRAGTERREAVLGVRHRRPALCHDTVQQLTGLRINHFVGVDQTGFGDLVDSVSGGVQMCVKQPVKDAQLGTIVAQGGPITLTGAQALHFVEADKVTGDTQPADFSRIERQQRFLAAVVRKMITQQNLLMSTTQLNTFLNTFGKSTFGDNMGVDQLVKLATSLQSLAVAGSPSSRCPRPAR